jgi:hypothetical protein
MGDKPSIEDICAEVTVSDEAVDKAIAGIEEKIAGVEEQFVLFNAITDISPVPGFSVEADKNPEHYLEVTLDADSIDGNYSGFFHAFTILGYKADYVEKCPTFTGECQGENTAVFSQKIDPTKIRISSFISKIQERVAKFGGGGRKSLLGYPGDYRKFNRSRGL